MKARYLFASLLALCALCLVAPAAAAQSGDAMGLGVGAQAFLTQTDPPAGASVTYDMGVFHVDGILAFTTLQQTRVLGGARFYYSLHRKASSDLSVGAGVGVNFVDGDEDVGEVNFTSYHGEVGGKIRVFVVPNVALSAGLGFGLIAGDEDGFVFAGQFVGTFGVTYFID